MNLQRIAAYCEEIAARADEAWGVLSGDPIRVANAKRLVNRAIARQHSEFEKEESERQLEDFQRRNRHWRF